MNYELTNALLTFVNMLCQMAPYLLLGFLMAGLLHVFVPSNFFERHLAKENFKSVLLAALIGVPLPLCSCGVIPTAISLRKDGASRGATVSFMISTPQIGVDSIIATYSMMGLPFAIVRPLAALLTSIAGGAVTTWFSKDEIIVRQNCSCENKDNRRNKLVELLKYSFIDLVQNIGKWLVIGLIIGTLITVLIPDSFFANLNLPSIVTMLIVLAIAVPMYVCSTGSIPIAAALMLKGLSPGAALVLLIAGPGVSIASLLVVGKSLGKKQLLFYLGSIIFGSIISGLFVDYFLPREWFAITSLCESTGHCASNGVMNASWFEIISGIVLVLLLINAFMLKFFKKEESINENQVIYRIDGMSCNHCKNSVEKAIKALDNVENVEVVLGKKEAVVTGKPNDEIVKKTVEELGFEFKGRK
ncbi:MAG: permease [Bacteroidales bacterium]|nr:permease [Bacteroidales bacterium]